MSAPDRVVIIGAGLSGAAAAWSLSRRGVPVVVAEQFTPGHRNGSSHGSARIVRRAYGDALYVSLTGEAFELWRELELMAGRRLLRMLGGVDFGPGRDVRAIAGLLRDRRVAHELLPAVEASARWPGMIFEGEVLFHEQAGTLDASAAVATLLGEAERLGAQVRYDTAAASVGEGVVAFTDGSVLPARSVVVAAGGWVGPLVSGVVAFPPLRVTRQQVFHFPRLDPTAAPWPSVIHEWDGPAVYHLAGGRDGGPGDDRKIGEHATGADAAAAETAASETAAPAGKRAIDPTVRARMIDYVQRWLPGLESAPRNETTCLYTETPSQDFVLDRVGSVVVCSPCSGHGAKFAPLIGEFVAALVLGDDTRPVPDRFRLATHLAGLAGPVSL